MTYVRLATAKKSAKIFGKPNEFARPFCADSRGATQAGHPAVCRMSLLDLFKATIVCGGVAFLFYSYPILGQIMAITVLSLLWLSYARKTVIRARGSQVGLKTVR
jgi:hypothetical protein